MAKEIVRPVSKKKKGVIKEKPVEEEPKKRKPLRDPLFVGMDPSFNGFAIIILDQDANIIEQKLITSNPKDDIEDRLMHLEAEYSFIPNIAGLHSVNLEGPAFLANGQFALQMGALHFMIRLMLKRTGVSFNIIAPGTLKKFVTGKGNAKKDLILLKVYKKWGVEFENDNLADAYGLARMALEEYKK